MLSTAQAVSDYSQLVKTVESRLIEVRPHAQPLVLFNLFVALDTLVYGIKHKIEVPDPHALLLRLLRICDEIDSNAL
jgi:hypothetical protein